jgi:two-component system chemotaxis sensor kinase CheA
MSSENDFSARLLEVFRTEARGHRLTITSALKELEKGADAGREAVMVEESFRAAHTLKGAAQAVNKGQIVVLCQSLEGIFFQLKQGRKRLGNEAFNALHEAVDRIEELEDGIEDGDSLLISRLKDIRGALDG